MAELLTVPEIKNHKIVNSREWTTARKELLRKEKELTHLRDELSRQRRVVIGNLCQWVFAAKLG